MLRRGLVGIYAGLTLLLTAAPAPAQVNLKGDLGIGYSFLKLLDEETIPLGWNVAAARSISDRVSVVGDFGGHYFAEHGDVWSGHTFTGGIRGHSRRTRMVTPFAQLAFGGIVGHETRDTGFAWVIQPGGGIDIRFRAGGAAFLAQVDLPLYFAHSEAQPGLRWVTGIVIPIK